MATPKNQSVLKAFAMLNSFHTSEEWLTSCELSRRAGLPEASGYRLIQTLEQIGAVVRGPRGRYRPGMLLLSLSRNVSVGELLQEASTSIVSRLSSGLNATVHIGVLEGGMVTYVAKVSAPHSFPIHTKLGAQLEPYCSGLGKVLLAALPPEELELFVLEGDLVALTPFTITEPARLLAEVGKVREQGYAIDDREHRADIRCVAVPIRDQENRVIAAISVCDQSVMMTPERVAQARDALLAASAELTCKVFPTQPDMKTFCRARTEGLRTA